MVHLLLTLPFIWDSAGETGNGHRPQQNNGWNKQAFHLEVKQLPALVWAAHSLFGWVKHVEAFGSARHTFQKHMIQPRLSLVETLEIWTLFQQVLLKPFYLWANMQKRRAGSRQHLLHEGLALLQHLSLTQPARNERTLQRLGRFCNEEASCGHRAVLPSAAAVEIENLLNPNTWNCSAPLQLLSGQFGFISNTAAWLLMLR